MNEFKTNKGDLVTFVNVSDYHEHGIPVGQVMMVTDTDVPYQRQVSFQFTETELPGHVWVHAARLGSFIPPSHSVPPKTFAAMKELQEKAERVKAYEADEAKWNAVLEIVKLMDDDEQVRDLMEAMFSYTWLGGIVQRNTTNHLVYTAFILYASTAQKTQEVQFQSRMVTLRPPL